MQCTLEEIAGFFDCSVDTIERWCKREFEDSFAETFKKYSAQGKISIRRNQLKLSEKNASMAIFLGKQYLGQSDNPVQEGKTAEILESLQSLLRGNDEVLD